MGSRTTELVRTGGKKTRAAKGPPLRKKRSVPPRASGRPFRLMFPASVLGILAVVLAFEVHANYTISFQSPVRLRFEWPVVIAHRLKTEDAYAAQSDQMGHALTAYQQYACQKFGPECRMALAIQRAENPQGKCEIYHYNTDGTLDWGYFQINTVHLKRPGLNLRDLLDCKANIDFAYQLFLEKGGFTPWSTYKNGAYRRYLRR
ncbi:MAG TPA: hypothetical protein VH351_12075 [Bryobacteraceae bacterium]|nr:hypothetical protein [Bryobacteraceae bacterium]